MSAGYGEAVRFHSTSIRRPRPAWRDLGLVRGGIVTGLIAAVLYVPVGLLDPTYLHTFAVTNLRRFTPESRHAAPVWYYLVWVPAMFFPWTLLAVVDPYAAILRPIPRPRLVGLGLIAWSVGGATAAILGWVPRVVDALNRLGQFRVSVRDPWAAAVACVALNVASGNPLGKFTRSHSGSRGRARGGGGSSTGSVAGWVNVGASNLRGGPGRAAECTQTMPAVQCHAEAWPLPC